MWNLECGVWNECAVCSLQFAVCSLQLTVDSVNWGRADVQSVFKYACGMDYIVLIYSLNIRFMRVALSITSSISSL